MRAVDRGPGRLSQPTLPRMVQSVIIQGIMLILHTADWHLGDRLGRIDRTADLRRAVERIGDYCRTENVDVLLVAGDLFSELARPDSLRETIEHWQAVFREFLASGGTILTLTGNHDNENFCRTLTHAMNLAAPTTGSPGERVPAGRLYLATEPTLLRLADRRDRFDVQFILMPYPTPTRYLHDEASQKYASPEEKNKLLVTAFEQTLRSLRTDPKFDPAGPAVLAAHAHVRGAAIGPGVGPCCYPTGAEVRERFAALFGEEVVHAPAVDLAAAGRRALLNAGVPASAITVVAACTSCEPERFFSHRRDGAASGRQAGLVWIP